MRRLLPGRRRVSTWARDERPARSARPPRDPRKRGLAFDVVAVLATLVLVLAGLANLAVVEGIDTAVRQAVIAAGGLVLLALFWRVRVGVLGVLGVVCYSAAVVLLAAVPVVGLAANGARRWIAVGGFTFQPSELAKLGMLLVVAGVLGSHRPAGRRFVAALVLAAVPIVLTVLQPDLSTTTLLVAVAVALLIIGRVPARYVLPVFATAAVAAPLAVGLLRPYQVERLGSFLAGAAESPAGAGWAVAQARIALATGGAFGRAGHPLTDVLERYLPERDTDLAPASVVLQFGMVAGVLVLLAAIVLVWRLAVASRTSRTAHGALLAGGLAVLFGTEVVVSVGGNLGLLPLAGVPFPLVSYGGTAVVVHLAAIGVVLGVRRDGARRVLWAAPERLRPRLVRVAALGVTAVLVTFGAFGWRLEAVEGPALVAAGQQQMERCVRLPAPRGEITDRHGAVLAVDAAATDSGTARIEAVPALVRPADVDRLAGLLGRPAADVRADLDAAPETTLSLELGVLPVAETRAVAGIPGVRAAAEPRRSYPTGELLGPVLGYIGVATEAQTRRDPSLGSGVVVGRAGLEASYDAVLRGLDGEQCYWVTPAGVPTASGIRREPVPGADLRTALDLPLQQRLTDSLRASLGAQRNPRAVGAAVAMDPRDGQVLALASLPAYDNNLFGPPVDVQALRAVESRPGHPTLEHASQVAVPPGSTFKLVVAAANVVHGTIPPETIIPTGASFTLAGHTFGNWRPMGPMNLPQAIAWSNDVYFYKLAALMGPDPIIEAAHALGVGAPTGIDLPGESGGYLGTPQTIADDGGHWYGGTTVILGIGQGPLQVTPLQNARWTAAIATGQLVTPRLGMAVGTPETGYTRLPLPAPVPVPFAAALGPVKDGMRAVVRGGTATSLSTLPLDAGGKTGTAQDGSLSGDEYDNWISVVAPLDAPTVVMTSLVQGHGKGGNSASRIAREGLQQYVEAPPGS
ncbi:FtsW/RodA/SpoVE family cell cycle protein [Pseudonocardia sp. RS010]|uniref:FtsW/RodA/SpoVE family cell cycle protein n=1 Tax=Pseudonocardia sp. RS010 TaxID=3385979 RepID=UPI0039A39FA3